MKIQKILTFVIVAIGLLGGILWYFMQSGISELVISSGVTEEKDLVKFPDKNPELFEEAISHISPLYTLVIVIGVILLIFTLVAVINGLIKNSKGIKNVIIGIAGFAFVLLLAYILATGADKGFELGKYEYDDIMATEGQSKMVGAGLIAFYILIFGAFLLMILSGIKKVISK